MWEAVVDIWTGRDRTRMQAGTDALHDKLSGVQWNEDITNDWIHEVETEGADKDPLADAVFRGRPSNPLGDNS
jgi:hypothetical protein